MPTLKLAGKPGSPGTLTFQDSGRRRVIAAGSDFEVDEQLAAVLLATDPNVSLAEAVAAAPAAPKYADLVARAKELGLPATGKGDALAAAIAAKEAELAVDGATNEGGTEPADDPDAASSGEAGGPPSTDGATAGGAITLGDLPDGAKLSTALSIPDPH